MHFFDAGELIKRIITGFFKVLFSYGYILNYTPKKVNSFS